MWVSKTRLYTFIATKLLSDSNISFLRFFLKTLFSYTKIIILFTVLWFLFSGSTDTLMLYCGFFAVFFTFFVCVATNIISSDTYIVKLDFFRYIYLLLKNVIISSIHMVKIIFSEKPKINPSTTKMNISCLTDQEKVLFANLTTMTPGTFVIAVDGNDFLVHALNKDDLEFSKNKQIMLLFEKLRSNSEKTS